MYQPHDVSYSWIRQLIFILLQPLLAVFSAPNLGATLESSSVQGTFSDASLSLDPFFLLHAQLATLPVSSFQPNDMIELTSPSLQQVHCRPVNFSLQVICSHYYQLQWKQSAKRCLCVVLVSAVGWLFYTLRHQSFLARSCSFRARTFYKGSSSAGEVELGLTDVELKKVATHDITLLLLILLFWPKMSEFLRFS
jgi:hypothetical protein